MPQPVDIEEFAKRVERLCDFLINKAGSTGSDDLRIIQDLKEDATDIQVYKYFETEGMFKGLSSHMKGVNTP
jgi:hypothetical protein